MNKKTIFCGLSFLFLIARAYPQLTIEECHAKARENYPLVRQHGLISLTEAYNLSNADKGYYPQISFSARGTYQSDVTSLPFTLPGSDVPEMDKDQYQAAAEISQVLWDGGMISAKKKITKAASEVDKQRNEVELYKLKDRVNQVFFGILLLDERLKQNLILQKELQRNRDLVTAYIQGGIASQSDADVIDVELLNAEQRRIELDAAKKAYMEMLAALTGLSIHPGLILEKPSAEMPEKGSFNNSLSRPELDLFEARGALSESRRSAVNAGLTPRISFFLQGGYGRPGLNMLDSEFSPFYIWGVRALWNLNGFYTLKNDYKLIEIEKESLETEKETFLFNNNLSIDQIENETGKIARLIENDDEIIMLRGRIKKAAENRVESGTLAISDLVKEINAFDAASQEKSLHEIQLLLAVYNLKNLTNN